MRLFLGWSVCLGALSGCLPPAAGRAPTPSDSAAARGALGAALRAYEAAALARRPDWALTMRGTAATYVTSTEGLRASWERQMVVRLGGVLESIDPAALSPREYASYQSLRWWLDASAEGATYRDIDFSSLSPSRTGLRPLLTTVRDYRLSEPNDTLGYLAVLRGLAHWVNDLPTALDLQAQDSARATGDVVRSFRGFIDAVRAANARGAFRLPTQRLTSLDSATTIALRLAERLAQDSLASACVRLLTYLGTYERNAPARWGLWQYAGGKEYYRHLLRRHTGLEITPEAAQRTALSELRRVDSLLAFLRKRGGSRLDHAAYRDSLSRLITAQRSNATATARRIVEAQAALRDTLLQALRIAQPALSVTIVADSLESALFPMGRVGLLGETDSAVVVVMQSPWWSTDAVNEGRGFFYRSIWPGQLVPLAARAGKGSVLGLIDIDATINGWAEYAGAIAGDLGMYSDLADSYGRVMHEGWTAALLLVDTGIHYFGWSKAQAMAALRPYSLATASILEETLVRDVLQQPGSAGAALLGRREFAAMRGWMRQTLGARFSLPEWHDAILSLGVVPLPVMANYLEWWSWDQQRRSSPTGLNRP